MRTDDSIKFNVLGYKETVFRDRQGHSMTSATVHAVLKAIGFAISGECSALTFLCRETGVDVEEHSVMKREASLQDFASAETRGSCASGSGKGLKLGGI